MAEQSDSEKRYRVWPPNGELPWLHVTWEDVKRVTGIPDERRASVDADVWPPALVFAGCTIEREIDR